MPSGAKKRKAAKKKQLIQSITNPSTNPQRENELKPIDEKGNDGGEGSSPVYRNEDDHDNRFNEGSEEVEEIEQSDAVVKSSEEVHYDGKIDGDGDKGGKEGVVVVELDMKSGESCENKNASVVQIESAKESSYVNGNDNLGVSNDNSVKEVAAFDEVVDLVKESVDSVAESSADSVNGVTFVSETREFDAKVSLSSVSQSPIPESTNGVEHAKDSNNAEHPENQPPVASAPLLVRKTSWLSCCGLFEVLSGSNR